MITRSGVLLSALILGLSQQPNLVYQDGEMELRLFPDLGQYGIYYAAQDDESEAYSLLDIYNNFRTEMVIRDNGINYTIGESERWDLTVEEQIPFSTESESAAESPIEGEEAPPGSFEPQTPTPAYIWSSPELSLRHQFQFILENVLQLDITIQNNTDQPRDVGLRYMFDTHLDETKETFIRVMARETLGGPIDGPDFRDIIIQNIETLGLFEEALTQDGVASSTPQTAVVDDPTTDDPLTDELDSNAGVAEGPRPENNELRRAIEVLSGTIDQLLPLLTFSNYGHFRELNPTVLTHETELPDGIAVPLVVSESPPEDDKPGLVMVLGWGSLIIPDRVIVANWTRLYNAQWHYVVKNNIKFDIPPIGSEDSAVAYYYDPQTIAPGSTRQISILIGTTDALGDAAFIEGLRNAGLQSTTDGANTLLAFFAAIDLILAEIDFYIENPNEFGDPEFEDLTVRIRTLRENIFNDLGLL